ncbi:MAG: 50S ribosomal protein L3 [Candidatus Xenolissoclinum pacificiensis L6]|uniref:50S ribosomal protein L3 n=1 Tax=Candidatus Xenolissoclinum pacificiensis L6 TaxID=1401685 RepID=W2UZD3_9RICK|nr:MAG: 50S ribosomal protein L3 [Candidatus Xenolissoclinum pacificiensis L6]
MVFQDYGERVAVVLLKLLPNKVVGIEEIPGGLSSVRMTFGCRKKINRPQSRDYDVLDIDSELRGVFRTFTFDDHPSHVLHDSYGVDFYRVGQCVDVTGVTKGKGFAGVMKRHGFSGLRASHGVSIKHRSGGSTGQCQDIGRVWKGKKMAGRMGGSNLTVQNLRIVALDSELSLIVVAGAVPGAKNSLVMLNDAKRMKGDFE